MVLQSQLPRETGTRRFVTSRRRRRRMSWPWLVLALFGLAVVFIIALRPENPTGTAAASGGESPFVALNPTSGPDNPEQASDETAAESSGQARETAVDAETSATDVEASGAGIASQIPESPPSAPRTANSPENSAAPPLAENGGDPAGISQEGSGLAGGPVESSAALKKGADLIVSGKLVEARLVLNDLLFEEGAALPGRDRQKVRDDLARLNEQLIFSSKRMAGDPLTATYIVQSGDALVLIAPRYHITDDLIAHINRIKNKHHIRVGQELKVINGPFHAVISKSSFRLDLMTEAPDGRRVYVKSFPVGLGEEDSTPLGKFKVGTKTANPSWRNPRKPGEFFHPDDPANPIGEHWIGLIGDDDATRSGYGIHGTIEPKSIGAEASMGCVRMRPKDVELIYSFLVTGGSHVEIVP